MEFFTPLPPKDAAESLGMALVVSSATPLLLLDGDLRIKAASASFCSALQLDPAAIVGAELGGLGAGEWNKPQLRSLLRAALTGDAAIPAYEFELVRAGHPTRTLVVTARRLDYRGALEPRVSLAISDLTDLRLTEKQRDDVVREKHVLLRELQHRVANSLQIIASILMQSARKLQSDEARAPLQDAHHRIMSIATLQRQLAASDASDVALKPYLTDLCESIGASMIYDRDLVTLTAIVDNSVTTSEVSVSLGLIVTELVINALKHAFTARETPGWIKVEYRSQANAWRLTVRDNGVGMPKDDAARKPGLGTGIVDALSKNLDATVTITANDPGTCVTVAHAAA